MARVVLPGPLREHVDGAVDLSVGGDTVLAALQDAARRFPRLRRHLFDDRGALRAYVNVYLDDEDVRGLDAGIDTRLGPDDTITIVPSIAGGDPANSDDDRGARPWRI
jgi:adenylyltransferase/sulfurtransferase